MMYKNTINAIQADLEQEITEALYQAEANAEKGNKELVDSVMNNAFDSVYMVMKILKTLGEGATGYELLNRWSNEWHPKFCGYLNKVK